MFVFSYEVQSKWPKSRFNCTTTTAWRIFRSVHSAKFLLQKLKWLTILNKARAPKSRPKLQRKVVTLKVCRKWKNMELTSWASKTERTQTIRFFTLQSNLITLNCSSSSKASKRSILIKEMLTVRLRCIYAADRHLTLTLPSSWSLAAPIHKSKMPWVTHRSLWRRASVKPS